jgi:hypothetical protein
VGAQPVAPCYVLLLTGPAGAGKTAVADAWARRQPHPTVHLSLDDVRDLVKAGYANPEDGASPEMWRQLDLARRGCVALATLYVGAGFRCVIDDAIFPDWEPAGYERWHTALGNTPHHLVALLPSFEMLIARNAVRRGRRRLREETLRVIYERMLPWRERPDVQQIDNSDLSIDEAAARLAKIAEAFAEQLRGAG